MWFKKNDHIALGTKGEKETLRFLKSRGYRILETNFKTRHAEIDIIARHQNTLCFIEVKTRKSLKKGRPVESVTPAKQNKIIQGALIYLKQNHLLESRIRFDVAEVIHTETGFETRLIENAFQTDGYFG